ncbi:hypothetical protein QBC37DRAFT_404553 [Rhypophila decipiens]|uniref:Uncharacterized protein n=1 Tax=Rhypophila decipiens TaxID=261697 RepID=A0AAN6XYV1_9PEZI|nr:hypothetical protein QBC37DRAFT_404553 [Rhypophila decipiens]
MAVDYQASGSRSLDGFKRTKSHLDKFPDSVFNDIVSHGTGRCTPFTIQTINRLNREHPGSYNFHIYRLGNHHLARCSRTGIVIDSSSKSGAFILNPGQELCVASEDHAYKNYWCFDGPNETSRFTKRHKSNSRLNQLLAEGGAPERWTCSVPHPQILVATGPTWL